MDFEIIGLSPDVEEDVKQALQLTESREGLREFFGIAKFIEKTLLNRVHNDSRKRIQIPWPRGVEALPCDVEPLNSAQIAIAKKYRAPH